jgi:DNA-binding CsgD family transcriptional regulator
MTSTTALRPIERRVLRLDAAGVDHVEIARRFQRSPEFIDRVIEMARLPHRRARDDAAPLRPLERRILAWREQGVDYGDIAPRFRRSADFVQRVEYLAYYKLDLR